MFKNSKTHIELAELLVQAAAGNQNAFAEIYTATVKPQYYLALKTLNDEVMAEDVTQEVFVYLFEHLKDIRHPIALVAYMNKVNYYLCLKALGKEKQGIGSIENFEVRSDMNNNSNETIKNLLESAMLELEPKMKEVVVLKYIQEFKTSEIAEHMNLSQRTVQRMIKNSLGAMKNSLKISMGRQYGVALICLPWMGEMINHSIKNLVSPEIQIRMFTHIASDLSLPFTGLSTATAVGGAFITSVKASTIKGIVMGAAAITAATLTMPHLIPPQFKILGVETTEYSIGNTYQILPKLGSSLKQVIVYDEQMREYINFQGKGDTEIYIANNGKYTIKVIDDQNRTSEKSLEVANIDITCPRFEVRFENDHVVMLVNDSESGIDFQTIKVINNEGNLKHTIDKENNEVTFLNTGKTQVTIKDKLGNATVIDIDKEIIKEEDKNK